MAKRGQEAEATLIFKKKGTRRYRMFIRHKREMFILDKLSHKRNSKPRRSMKLKLRAS